MTYIIAEPCIDIKSHHKRRSSRLGGASNLPCTHHFTAPTAQARYGAPGQRGTPQAARRQKWIDQSQSLNLFLAQPDLKTLSHMYRHAWRAGLKTTYYLRTLGASTIEKATVAARRETAAPEAAAVACSIEAALNGVQCEACQ